MKKILLVILSLGALYSENMISSEKELSTEKLMATESNELEKLKSLELDQTKKSILIFENNPLVQSLLMSFLKNAMESSEGKFQNIMSKYTEDLSSKIRKRVEEEVNILKIENLKIRRNNEEKDKELVVALKLTISNELVKIKKLKLTIEKNRHKTETQMGILKNVFNEVQDKMDSYTKYIDSKFSLQAVKDIELSRMFLIKDKFPISYIKNFNSKSDITIIMNSDKEYGINSMITDRCRIEMLTNTHITIECIDTNDKIYNNIMKLVITSAKEDYILNARNKKKNDYNSQFSESSKEESSKNETSEQNIVYN